MRRSALAGLVVLALFSPAPAAAQVVDMASAEHATLAAGIEAWHYLRRDDLSVMRMRFAPGASEERHLHRRTRLFVTLLSGGMTVEIDGTIHVVAPGQAIEIPPGAPHRASNPGATAAEAMVVAMPPSAGDREAVPALVR
jgi:mannose-6-phosphate isomerase-like protein (cupin superfamily)